MIRTIRVKGVCFVIHNKLLSSTPEFILMRFILINEDGGLVARGTNYAIRGLEFSAHPFTSGEGRGAGD